MLPGSNAVKSTAKASLKGKWPQAIAVSLITVSVFLISVLSGQLFLSVIDADAAYGLSDLTLFPNEDFRPELLLVTLFSALLTLILTVPLNLGVLRWFWRLTYGADDTVGSIFHYFSSLRLFWRAISFQLLLYLRVLLIGILVFLPAAVVDLITNPEFYSVLGIQVPLEVTSYYGFSAILTLLGFFALLLLLLQYYASPFLLINDEELTPNRAVSLSSKVTKGSKVACLLLCLSFFGWLLLSFLALPVLFVLPYLLASYAVFTRYALHANNHRPSRPVGYTLPDGA